jgi:hypothetical protein
LCVLILSNIFIRDDFSVFFDATWCSKITQEFTYFRIKKMNLRPSVTRILIFWSFYFTSILPELDVTKFMNEQSEIKTLNTKHTEPNVKIFVPIYMCQFDGIHHRSYYVSTYMLNFCCDCLFKDALPSMQKMKICEQLMLYKPFLYNTIWLLLKQSNVHLQQWGDFAIYSGIL